MREMIEMMKRYMRNESWKEEMESWKETMRQATTAAAKASFDLRLEHAKPRLTTPRRLLIEVFTNRPVEDRIADRWKTMRIDVKPSYTMKEVYHKVGTRWKDRWKVEWPEEMVDNVKTWGQEGQIEDNQLRTWEDGTRFIMLIQMKGEQFLEEMMQEEGLWNKFLEGSRWKKKMWNEWLASGLSHVDDGAGHTFQGVSREDRSSPAQSQRSRGVPSCQSNPRKREGGRGAALRSHLHPARMCLGGGHPTTLTCTPENLRGGKETG
jgi:hypothetical protein